MKSLRLYDVLQAINGEIICGDINIILKKIVTWPQRLKDETLCFDLFRTGSFNSDLLKDYKSFAIITDRPEDYKNLYDCASIIKVKNRHTAYWRFIEYYRSSLSIPIIGIAGTCGKTTTKEMTKYILSRKHKVCSTYQSCNVIQFNSMYMLKSDEATEFGVFEMGLNEPGDLADNCRYLKPQIRVLLNIGVYHLEGCKTPEDYIKAKGEIVEGINESDGTLILNADDNNIKKIDISKVKKIIYFGINTESDYKAKDISYGLGGMNFVLSHNGIDYNGFVPGYGNHNVYDALAAIAATVEAGMDVNEAIENLKSYKHVIEHLQVKSGQGDCIVIDDTWSSAPPSVEAALNVLGSISEGRKKIAIIGISPLLGEGEHAKEQYAKMGEKAVKIDTDILIVASEQAKEIGIRAIELGMDKNKVYFSYDGREIYGIISKSLNKNTIILLKVTHRQMVEESFTELKKRLISE